MVRGFKQSIVLADIKARQSCPEVDFFYSWADCFCPNPLADRLFESKDTSQDKFGTVKVY